MAPVSETPARGIRGQGSPQLACSVYNRKWVNSNRSAGLLLIALNLIVDSSELAEAREAIDFEFGNLKQQVAKAEKAFGDHLEFWSILDTKIQTALLNPERLPHVDRGPQLTMVKSQREAWGTIRTSFEGYHSQVRLSFIK